MVVIRWRDIPAQVSATAGGVKHTRVLDDRFQHAIDRAAAVAGLTDTQSYVAEWKRDTHPLDEPPDVAVARMVEHLHTSFDRVRLEALVARGGGIEHPERGQDEGGLAP